MKILSTHKNPRQSALPSLILCIVLDVIGMASFTIPFIGEFSDVIWAPLSGFVYYRLFSGKMGVFGECSAFWKKRYPLPIFYPLLL